MSHSTHRLHPLHSPSPPACFWNPECKANNRQKNCNQSELITIDPQSVSRTILAFFPSTPPSVHPLTSIILELFSTLRSLFWTLPQYQQNRLLTPTHLLVLIFRGTLTSYSILGFFFAKQVWIFSARYNDGLLIKLWIMHLGWMAHRFHIPVPPWCHIHRGSFFLWRLLP